MRPLLLPLYFLFSTTTVPANDWTGISECGSYQVRGVSRTTKNGLVIVVNEKSQSEIIISLSIPNEAKLAPYLDKALVATVVFESKAAGPQVKGTIVEIDSRIPDPLKPKDTGIKMISKAECKK